MPQSCLGPTLPCSRESSKHHTGNYWGAWLVVINHIFARLFVSAFFLSAIFLLLCPPDMSGWPVGTRPNPMQFRFVISKIFFFKFSWNWLFREIIKFSKLFFPTNLSNCKPRCIATMESCFGSELTPLKIKFINSSSSQWTAFEKSALKSQLSNSTDQICL